MKKKYYLILLFIIFIISVGFIFYKNSIKNLKIGNNKNSQEIVDYILNLSSYEAEVTVNITSNKNSNKYILKQKYQKDKEHIQEVIEPSNIAGVKIINDGKNLKIENSNLNLNEIIENYTNLENNNLDLSMFIDEYKNSNESNYEEKDDEIIMKVKNDKENIYVKEKILYINKKTYKPVKLEIKDNKQKERIYILYNEVKINSLDKQNILAFRLYNTKQEI